MKLAAYSRFTWAAILCAIVLPALAQAQVVSEQTVREIPSTETASDAIIVSGQWQNGSGNFGGGGSIDWLHKTPRSKALSLGLANYRFAGSQRTLGHAGAFFQFAKRWTLEPQAILGGGSTAGNGFIYQQYQAQLGFRASPRLYFKAQEEYFHVAGSHGHLLSTGATAFPSRLFSIDLSYAHSAGGNLGTDFAVSRLDYYRKSLRPFAGFALGHTAPILINTGFGDELVPQDFHETFGGVVVPISHSELTVAVDWIRIGSTTRTTLTVASKFPIRANSPPRSKP